MGETCIDLRGLLPPEPLERVLAALDSLAEGGRLRVILDREPFPLYDLLECSGHHHAAIGCPDGSWEVRIWR